MVTLKEVAAAAQVSTVTASSVLSGVNRVRVSPATAERIHRIAKSMNYVPLAAARGLRTGKTRIIALVTACNGMFRPDNVWHEALRGVSDLMWDREERLMLVMPRNREHQMEIIRQMAYGRQVDGFIIQDVGEDRELVDLLSKSERPFVMMGGAPMQGVNNVSFDIPAFARDIAESLQNDGCQAVVSILPAQTDERFLAPFTEFFQSWSWENAIPYHPWRGAFIPDGQWLADKYGKLGGKKVGIALHRALLPETIKSVEDAHLTLGDMVSILYVSMGEDILLTPKGVMVMQLDHYTLGRRSAQLLFRLVDGPAQPTRPETVLIPAAQKT
ncbi:MAG: LacI family transcriptional regulator [Planctomycetes bacterium]|nr:LacI family transcriptional regulator [Planctomycetota bacterium]